MFEKGQFIYHAPDSGLSQWQDESPVGYAFVTAALATIISYQAAAIIIDLTLGIKKPGEVSMDDSQVLLIAEDSFLGTWFFYISRVVCKRIFQGKKYFNNDERGEGGYCEHGLQLSPPATIKLVLLIVAIPAVNLATIVMALESDSIISFQGADLGGVSLQQVSEFDVTGRNPVGRDCFTYPVRTLGSDIAVAEIFQCSEILVSFDERTNNVSRAKIVVTKTATEEIVISAQYYAAVVHFHERLDMRSQGRSYRIKTGLDAEQGSWLAARAGNILLSICSDPGELLQKETVIQDDSIVVSQTAICGEMTEDNVISALAMARIWVKPVYSSQIHVAELDEDRRIPLDSAEFLPADNLPLLRRRSAYVSLLALCVTAASIIVVRIGVNMVTNNDIDLCLELMLKRLGCVPCCESMLQSEARINYDCSDGKFGLAS